MSAFRIGQRVALRASVYADGTGADVHPAPDGQPKRLADVTAINGRIYSLTVYVRTESGMEKVGAHGYAEALEAVRGRPYIPGIDAPRNFGKGRRSKSSSSSSSSSDSADKGNVFRRANIHNAGDTCPACNFGTLQRRNGRFGEFLGCSTFPVCRYTEKAPESNGSSSNGAEGNGSSTEGNGSHNHHHDDDEGHAMQAETETDGADALTLAIAGIARREVSRALSSHKAGVDAEAVKKIVTEALAGRADALRIRIEKQDGNGDWKQGKEMTTHRQFPKLVKAMQARQFNGQPLNAWLVGPPGTGKTTAAEQLGEAFGLPVYLFSNIASAYDLTGGRNVQGEYVRTQFRECVEHGGIAVFDEITGNDPQALLFINAFLANGVVAFPDKTVKRHADCYVIAGDQTRGNGSTSRYVSRNKMDAATLSRFVFIDWPIDPALEELMSGGNGAWLAKVRAVRANVEKQRIDTDITPRNTAYGAALIAAGFTVEEAEEMALRGSLNAEVWAKVKA